MKSCKLFLVFFLTISRSRSEYSYTDDELAIIKHLGNLLGIRSFTFVQNHQNEEFIKEIKNFKGNLLPSVVADVDELDVILNDLHRELFFERKTILVTKEKLNFTTALEKLSGILSLSWIVFVDSPFELNNSYIPINADFFVVHHLSDTTVINKAYKIKPELKISFENVGIWRNGGIRGTLRIESDRINFRRTNLIMLYYLREADCNSKSSIHVLDRMECFHQEALRIISGRLNFRHPIGWGAMQNKKKRRAREDKTDLKYWRSGGIAVTRYILWMSEMECPERVNPYNYPNGSLSEIFLILKRREVDFSSGSFIVTEPRMEEYDFAWPTFTTRSLMYIKFEDSKSNWGAYLRPMDSRSWKAIVSWITLTGLLVQFFEEFRGGNFKLRLALVTELIESIFLSLQVSCNQGIDNMSKWISSRIVFLVTFLLFVSLYQAYSGFLISSLTVSIPRIPFLDLEGLVRDGTYKLMTRGEGFHNYYLKRILKERRIKSADFLLSRQELPNTTQAGIEKLCSSERLTYIDFRENIVDHELPCKITELPKHLLFQNLGIGLPKNSPYKKVINRQVILLRSTGILNRMNRYLLSYVSLRSREITEEEYIKVSFQHVVSIFFILGSGTAIAVGIFFVEILWNPSTRPNILYFYKRKPEKQKIKEKEIRLKRKLLIYIR